MRALPYWWVSKRRDSMQPLEFSSYVIGRMALEKATYSRECGVTAPYSAIPDNMERVLKCLYDLLTTLDSKASALMRLNGVMLAAAAFLLNQTTKAPLVHKLVAFSAIGSSLSIAFCLFVVSVDWRFLGLVQKSCTSDGVAQLDFSDEFFHLQNVSGLRQTLYQVAWSVSLITTVLFLVAAAIFFGGIVGAI